MPSHIKIIFFVVLITAGCSSVQKKDLIVKQDPVSINKNDSTVTVIAGKIYQADELKRFFLGDHYRDVWLEPVEVPIVNLQTEKGGLEIVERGGGMQTYSLKVKAADGKLYTFRSIQKDPSPVLPELLQNTIADDIIQDQISASHPYGAFILPLLADAAGIYHTNPELFYLPDDPELGKYREDFGGMLVMLEEDADEDWSDYEDFGYTENAVSTSTLREDLREDNDNEVDQRFLLRARLFDMWIGDWDRHEGQWRWAEIEKKDEKGTLYRPIPEDRDNVFFKFDGVIPWIASRKWAERKFRTFKEDVTDIAGLNYNARDFDRRFLTELSKEDWFAVADTLQRRLDDQVIEQAVQLWPDGVYELTGKEIGQKLKARREKLKEFALDYYHILAEEVNVFGSDKHEYFEVERLNDQETQVTVYKSNDDGEKKKVLYQRTFDKNVTDEVRLYGFDNADFFHIHGEVDEGMVVRIIGGQGPDQIIDESHVTGLSRKTKVYDLKEDTDLEGGIETRDFTSTSLDVNKYEFKSFEYDLVAPQLFFGYNIDDGLFIGGGIFIKTHGFRKEDFSTRHRILGNVALLTGAYNFIYEGNVREFFKSMDLDIDLNVRAPNFTSNFFGLGNGTKKVVEAENFYRYRRDEVDFNPGLQVRFGNSNYFKLGPSLRYDNIWRDADNFVTSPEAGIADNAFDKKIYGGLYLEARLNSTNDQFYPENGINWITRSGLFYGMFGEENSYGRLESSLSLYVTPREWPVTLALRFGGASNIGDFYFFQANTLGGNAGFNTQGHLRGYVRDRFAGRTSLYQNTELRLQLINFKFYVLPVQLGLMAFIDHGRVYSAGMDQSDDWHRGYGAGFFLRPVGKWVFTGTYAVSEEDNLINASLGFMF